MFSTLGRRVLPGLCAEGIFLCEELSARLVDAAGGTADFALYALVMGAGAAVEAAVFSRDSCSCTSRLGVPNSDR
jgi:hypothetical protein